MATGGRVWCLRRFGWMDGWMDVLHPQPLRSRDRGQPLPKRSCLLILRLRAVVYVQQDGRGARDPSHGPDHPHLASRIVHIHQHVRQSHAVIVTPANTCRDHIRTVSSRGDDTFCLHRNGQVLKQTWLRTHIGINIHIYKYIFMPVLRIRIHHPHIHIHTRAHIHSRTYRHTYIHTYIHTCIHASMHTCIHGHMHTSMHTYLHTYIPTYIHTYIRTHVHTYVHTYMHLYKLLLSLIHAYIYICSRYIDT